jgi:hypothetical protein
MRLALDLVVAVSDDPRRVPADDRVRLPVMTIAP